MTIPAPGATPAYSRRGGIPCRLGQFRLGLGPDERANLDAWIAGQPTHKVIAMLRDEGFIAGTDVVTKHRRGDCVWCRTNAA